MHKNIIILRWFNFFTDFKLYAPVAIIYFSNISGSFALGMSVFSIVMISSAIFEIPTGIFSDRIGRKKTIVLGSLAAVIYSLFYALSSSYTLLVIGAVFEGISRSFYSGNNDALLHDSLSEQNQKEKFSEQLGKTSSMFQVALAVSAILGGFLASYSFTLIVWLSIIPQAICFILSLKIVEPRLKSKSSGNIFAHIKDAYKNFLSNKKLRTLSIASILGFAFGEAGYQFQSAFYNTVWPLWAIGIAKTLSNINAALSFHFSDKILKKYSGLKIIITDNIYNRAVNIFSVVFPSIFSPILMSSTSIFFGVVNVAKNSLLQKEFTDEQRATMGSLNSFAGSVLFGIIAFLLGVTADIISPSRAYLLLQIFQIANIFLYFKVFKSSRKT